MTSPHTLSFRLLLSSLTGLVLLALAAAYPELRLNSHKAVATVEASSQALKFGSNDSGERRSVITAVAALDIDDEDPPRVAPGASSNANGQHIAFALEFVPTRRAAALTHPLCASPPTGPPHA